MSLLKKIYFRILFFLKKIIVQKRAIIDSAATVYWSAKFHNSGLRNAIVIKANSHVMGTFMIFGHGGYIEIGEDSYVGHNTYIWSAKSIKIGNRVLISHGVNIHDNNSHPIDATERHLHFKYMLEKGHPTKDINLNEKEIIIEDDAWIGFNATILKGVKIGKGAIVSSCSVVTKDVPPFTIVVGNPAKVIKSIEPKNE